MWFLAGNQGNHHNFVPSSISKNLWLIFMEIKQKTKQIWKKGSKMANSKKFFNHASFKLALLGKTCKLQISILNHEYFYTFILQLISLKPIVYRARRIECAIKIYCLHKIEPLFPLWKRKAAPTKINFFPSPCLAKCFTVFYNHNNLLYIHLFKTWEE